MLFFDENDDEGLKEFKKKSLYYTKTDIIKMGFTEKFLNDLIDSSKLTYIEKTNPHRSSLKMKLFLKEDIEKIISTEEFKNLQENKKAVRERALKAVDTKRKKLHEQVDKAIKKIRVKKIKNVEYEALESKRDWYEETGQYDKEMDLPEESYNIDRATMVRWDINFIRHNLTDYDDELYEMKGKVGCEEEYERYRTAVFDKIAMAYPKIFEEYLIYYKKVEK